jgi:hypothetical protein
MVKNLFFPGKDVARWAPGSYRVKSPFSWRSLAELLALIAVIVGGLTFIGLQLKTPIALALYIMLRWPFSRYKLQRTALGVLHGAVIVDGLLIPWIVVRRVDMAFGPTGETTFAISLFDARYVRDQPAAVRALQPGPDGVHLRRTVSSPVDPARLGAALRLFAPQHVALSGLDPSLLGESAESRPSSL